ncbi:MAG TPA: hypothetical protein VGL33_33830 [Streptosporangiaceae bacterium]
MKISYVIPGPMSQGPLGPREVARRQDILRGCTRSPARCRS